MNSRVSTITQKFANNGDTVYGFNSIRFLDCGCVGKCSFTSSPPGEHPDMKTWKFMIDKQTGYYLPKWISFFDSQKKP